LKDASSFSLFPPCNSVPSVVKILRVFLKVDSREGTHTGLDLSTKTRIMRLSRNRHPKLDALVPTKKEEQAEMTAFGNLAHIRKRFPEIPLSNFVSIVSKQHLSVPVNRSRIPRPRNISVTDFLWRNP